MEETINSPKTSRKLIIVVLLLVLLTSLAANAFLIWWQLRPDLSAADRVSWLIHVPLDEEPTIAEITDVEVLREQQPKFYRFAESGDLLLVYSDRAVLYRESENKIVGVTLIL